MEGIVENKTELVNSDQTMSSDIGKLAEALAKAQSEMSNAIKDSNNPFFKSKYADLAAVWDAIRPHFGKHGLAVIQTTNGSGDYVKVITMLAHSSGQWIRGELKMKPVKSDPQGIGSALTYSRRYALAAICGVAQEDDDAISASGKSVSNDKISEKDAAEIRAALEETNSDTIKFCEAFGISSVTELPKSSLQSAKSAIKRKRASTKSKKDEVQNEVA